VVAPDVSVLLAVVELDGWLDAAAPEPLPNEPPPVSDSPASESEVICPAPSVLGFWLVTYRMNISS